MGGRTNGWVEGYAQGGNEGYVRLDGTDVGATGGVGRTT